MRILCVSDQIDPLVYSLGMKERFRDVDLVLSAGDLPAEYLGFITSMLNKPLLSVSGNHDLGKAVSSPTFVVDGKGYVREEEEHGAIDCSFRLVREGGLIVLGLPGSMLYNGGPNQFTEAAMAARIAWLAPRLWWNRLVRGRAVDLVLTHAPPRGIHDRDDPCHRGFRSFLWLMRTFRPRWLVHGHVHLYDLGDVRVSRYEGTMVLNAFGHWILETQEG